MGIMCRETGKGVAFYIARKLIVPFLVFLQMISSENHRHLPVKLLPRLPLQQLLFQVSALQCLQQVNRER